MRSQIPWAIGKTDHIYISNPPTTAGTLLQYFSYLRSKIYVNSVKCHSAVMSGFPTQAEFLLNSFLSEIFFTGVCSTAALCCLWTYHLSCVILMNCMHCRKRSLENKDSQYLLILYKKICFSKRYNKLSYFWRHKCYRLWNYHQQNIGSRRFHHLRLNNYLGMVADHILDTRNWSSLIS